MQQSGEGEVKDGGRPVGSNWLLDAKGGVCVRGVSTPAC